MESSPFKIMVAVDFSDGADRAVDQAVRLAGRLGATLEIVHVSTLPTASPAELMAPSPIEAHTADEARRQLGQYRDLATAEGVTAATRLRVGDVTYGLLQTIEELAPDLVIVGSHGKGVIARALLGSVSEALCRRSPTPVMVVPAPGRRHGAARIASSCAACGHIFDEQESTERCSGCGISPVRWLSATISTEPIDAIEPHVSDGERDQLPYERTGSTQGLFAMSPPGTEGYDVNPELRVRY